MKGVFDGGILRVAAALLVAIAGCCDARADAVYGNVSVSLTIVDSCTVSRADRDTAIDTARGRASGPVHAECSGGPAPSVTFARVPRAIASAAAGIAPPAGGGAFHAEREDSGGESIVRATVTF
jgi:hypothetical protein